MKLKRSKRIKNFLIPAYKYVFKPYYLKNKIHEFVF